MLVTYGFFQAGNRAPWGLYMHAAWFFGQPWHFEGYKLFIQVPIKKLHIFWWHLLWWNVASGDLLVRGCLDRAGEGRPRLHEEPPLQRATPCSWFDISTFTIFISTIALSPWWSSWSSQGKTSGPFACSDIEEQTGKYGSTETKCGNSRSCKFVANLTLKNIITDGGAQKRRTGSYLES